MGVADTVCRTCLRSVKADGKERPATLGVVVSSPIGKNPHDRIPRTPRQEENGAALTLAWHRVILPGFALPRVPAGGRPSSPGGGSKPFLPLRRRLYA